MNIIVLDTETIGKNTQNLLNVGWLVVDVERWLPIQTYDYIITKIYNNKAWCLNDDFVGAKKYDIYTTLLNAHAIKKGTIKSIMRALKASIKKYHVERIYAYNCAFDRTRLKEECDRNGIEWLQDVAFMDIWSYARDRICSTQEYKEWAIAHDALTATNLLSTNVQNVARYLRNNDTFEEQHTALADVGVECDILKVCIDRGASLWVEPIAPKYIASGVKRCDTFMVDGEPLAIEYTKKYTRGEIVYYKNEEGA